MLGRHIYWAYRLRVGAYVMLEIKAHQFTSKQLQSSAEAHNPEREDLLTVRFPHYGYASALLDERSKSFHSSSAAKYSLSDYRSLTARKSHP